MRWQYAHIFYFKRSLFFLDQIKSSASSMVFCCFFLLLRFCCDGSKLRKPDSWPHLMFSISLSKMMAFYDIIVRTVALDTFINICWYNRSRFNLKTSITVTIFLLKRRNELQSLIERWKNYCHCSYRPPLMYYILFHWRALKLQIELKSHLITIL